MLYPISLVFTITTTRVKNQQQSKKTTTEFETTTVAFEIKMKLFKNTITFFSLETKTIVSSGDRVRSLLRPRLWSFSRPRVWSLSRSRTTSLICQAAVVRYSYEDHVRVMKMMMLHWYRVCNSNMVLF